MSPESVLPPDPLWFKDAIIYELHVKTFFDGNGDGVGDFEGLLDKLDYLADLGVTAIWVLPFYPSPLRDDGYDIADYYRVNPMYGSLDDVRRFVDAAHARGLRVITELVINHTSDQHAWFQRARRAPHDSPERAFYVWSDDPERYAGTRVIFQDYERSNWTWDPVAEQYYWHRFYSHQPDLNFDNPEVQKEIFSVLDFWLELGIDGLRLDAVPYLYEREGTNCENLAETHAFLKKLRAHTDAKFPNRMLLAEANQWPEDAAAYFGDGDECHMNFHFPLMPRMFMALQLESNFPILDILAQTPAIPDSCQWAVFLRNHDELTLEMVTDEDRDYMYRVYAANPRARVNLGIRRRLAPLMRSRTKVELMNGLLFSMPGTPVLYYGDEIGMGDNIYLGDRDSVRTPMQWSSDRNAGFSRANPQRLYLPIIIDPEYHYEAVNVEAQQENPDSLLYFMKRLVALRSEHHVFGRGTIELLDPENPKVLAFLRSDDQEHILVVANLSRFAQYTELDLSRYAGTIPTELFGHTEFPTIGQLPYLLTLPPHSFYWFALEPPGPEETEELGDIRVSGSFAALFEGRGRRALEGVLPTFLRRQRWFRDKNESIRAAVVTDVVTLDAAREDVRIAIVEARFPTIAPKRYAVPLAFATGERATWIAEHEPHSLVARLTVVPPHGPPGESETPGVVHDATVAPTFATAFLGLFAAGVTSGEKGQLVAERSAAMDELVAADESDVAPHVLRGEQTNTSIVFGTRAIAKLVRTVEEGINLDIELGRFLTERAGYRHTPEILGSVDYVDEARGKATVAIVHAYEPNQGDAWALTLDALGRYFDRALSTHHDLACPEAPDRPLLALASEPVPEVENEIIGEHLPLMAQLAERVAELHLALTSDQAHPELAQERLTELHQRSLYQSARTRLKTTLKELRRESVLESLSSDLRERALHLAGREDALDALLRRIIPGRLTGTRSRCHGDLHLGQVLYTGKDFVIIDFEGEPARPLSERRFKRSPLVDVAGMLRSFEYAAEAALRDARVRRGDVVALEPWADVWRTWIAATFLGSYLERARSASFLPTHEADLATLLDFFVLDKCLYELGYELGNRPDWLAIPLRGLERALERGGG